MHHSSVILSWGPPRMGTTWLFNVLQAMAKASSTPVAIVADHAPAPPVDWAGGVIIKSHRADPIELVSSFSSRVPMLACVMVRDALPTFRSLVRTQKASRSEVIGWLEKDMDSYEAVLPFMSHVAVIREEWVEPRAPEIVEALGHFLGMTLSSGAPDTIAASLSRAEVRKVVSELDAGQKWSGDFRNFDTSSQWHAGHIAPEEQSDFEVTPTESQRLSALQARIDSLAWRFALWESKGVSTDVLRSDMTSCRPLDYVQARAALLFPPPTFWMKFRHALGLKVS